MTARSTAEARKLDPTGIVVFRQGDVGEYLREVLVQLLFCYYRDFLANVMQEDSLFTT